jgi:predicted MFS family arabinose efflux permease
MVFVSIAVLYATAGVALFFELYRRRGVSAPPPAHAVSAVARLATMLRRPWVAVVLAGAFFEGMVFFGAYTFVGSYLWARFDLSFDLIGLIVAGFGIGGLIYAATASRMVPRLGEAGLLTWGGVLVAVSFVAITVAPSAAIALPATILAGFSYYMIHNTLQTHATQMAPDARGLAVATFASCLFLGQAVGVALAAPVFDNTGAIPIFLAAGVLLFLFGQAYRSLLLRRA